VQQAIQNQSINARVHAIINSWLGNTYGTSNSQLGITALSEAVIKTHGHVNLLVNNAGVSVAGRFLETSLTDLEWLMRVNFWGTVYCCKAFLPLLLKESEAHVVTLCSSFGLLGFAGLDGHKAAGVAIREAAQEQGVDDGEDGGVAADAERQRQQCDRRESRVLPQVTQGIANVFPASANPVAPPCVGLERQPPSPGAPDLLAQFVPIGELRLHPAQGVRWFQAAGWDVKEDGHLLCPKCKAAESVEA